MKLANVYRYLSEAMQVIIFKKWYGCSMWDAGLFMSYVGLNSFYQAENWEYQAFLYSDNTLGSLTNQEQIFSNPKTLD